MSHKEYRMTVTAALLCLCFLAPSGSAQVSKNRPSAQGDSLQEHYDLAQRFQGKGNFPQAEAEYKLFLSEALYRVSGKRSSAGEFPQALSALEQALEFAPTSIDIRLAFAGAALETKNYPQAVSEAREVLGKEPQMAKGKRISRAHLILGRALMGLKENQEAKEQFEAAVALDSSFVNGYALAQCYLALSDLKNTARLFAEMQAGFGDTAAIHMEFGRAYGEADYPEQAIVEFKKVVAKDERFAGAHYSLGASYLLRSGDTAFPQAEAEFRKELAAHPDDYLSYSQLGYIAMTLRRLPDAVEDLSRAAKLNPGNPDNYLLLGQIYSDLNLPAQAEDALRKAIAASTDDSHNHYQIRGAHYQLGLLLLQSGRAVEGKQEMKISEELLLKNRALDQANLTGKVVPQSPFAKTSVAAASGNAAEVKEYEGRIGPAIADSYNNMGAMAASNQEYEIATEYFEQAAVWNPTMDGLDYNWGRAAFAAKKYQQAELCMKRYVQAHPGEASALLPLGMSEFMLGDYLATVKVLTPMAGQLEAVPLVDYAYGESLIRTGDVNGGLARLRSIERVHADLPVVHRAIGEALASLANYQEAQGEFVTATQLDSTDLLGKYDLALTDIALSQKEEATTLLKELAVPECKQAEVFYQLGKLQLDRGETKAAIRSLETASRLDPASVATQRELAEANRRDGRSGTAPATQ